MFDRRAFLDLLREETGLDGDEATIMARWAIGDTYRVIASTMRGFTVGMVAAVIRDNRQDGYSKPKGPLLRPRSTPTSLRTTPTVHEMRGRTKSGRLSRGTLYRRGFNQYDLLKHALKEKNDDTG